MSTSNASTLETPEPTSRRRTTRALRETEMLAMQNSIAIHAATNIAEYKWPTENLDFVDNSCKTIQEENSLWMVQEQVAAFLGVTSFKRKYPDIERRKIESDEAMWLLDHGLVTEYLIGLGLYAIKACDVHMIMQLDYADKYDELLLSLAEKERRKFDETGKRYAQYLKELRAVAKCNSTKNGDEIDPETVLEASQTTSELVELASAKGLSESLNESEFLPKFLSKTDTKMTFQPNKKNLQIMKNSQKFSRKMTLNRKKVFNAYYDEQTNVMQYPRDRKYRKVDPELTRFDEEYPVVCLPGQYSSYFKKFSSEEMAYLPLGSCLRPGIMKDHKLKMRVQKEAQQTNFQDKDSLDLENLICGQIPSDPNRPKPAANRFFSAALPQATTVDPAEPTSGDEDLVEDDFTLEILAASVKAMNGGSNEKGFVFSSYGPNSSNQVKDGNLSDSEDSGEFQESASTASSDTPMICSMCGKDERYGHFVYCTKCRRYGHAECLKLTPKVLAAIRTYQWRCMDCKVCVICSDLADEANDEDNLLFCDFCDKGYHLHCVNLDKVPRGAWCCPECKEIEEEQIERVEEYRKADRKRRDEMLRAKEMAKEEKERARVEKIKKETPAKGRKGAKTPAKGRKETPVAKPKSVRKKK